MDVKWVDRHESGFDQDEGCSTEAILRRQTDSPDLTERIMHELGYDRANRLAHRRATTRRWLRRGATLCLLFGMLAFGAYVHQWSDAVRKPSGPTIHSAMSSDIEARSSAVGDAIRHWGSSLVPQAPPPPSPPVVSEPCVTEDGGACRNQSRVPWSGLL